MRYFYNIAVVIALSGCYRPVAQAAPVLSAPPVAALPSSTGGLGALLSEAPAPFTTPPVLTATLDVATLVAKIKPAVVNITTIQEIKGIEESPFSFLLPFFGGMRPNNPNNPMPDEGMPKRKGLGSGFIISSSGLVVTNAHVVKDANQVRVKLADDREFDAKVKGRDNELDVAVLELSGAKNLPSASLGSSDTLRVGEYLVAIGNPFGLGHTVTMGILSAKGRAIGESPYQTFLQTDASINPGNSGGPLFNSLGQVIGINTAINPQGQGIGFAIPIDTLREILPQLLSTGRVSRGRLGVGIQPVDEKLAKAVGLDRARGAMVSKVYPDSPAQRAGLQEGDVIISVNEIEINQTEELPRLIARNPPGTEVSIKLLRERSTRTFKVVLDKLQSTDKSDETPKDEQKNRTPSSIESKVGFMFEDSSEGIIVGRILSNGPADGVLRSGDTITEVDRKPVSKSTELSNILAQKSKGQFVVFKVKRNSNARYVAIELR